MFQNPPAVLSTPSASSVAAPESQVSDEVKFEFDPDSWIPRRKRAREENSDDEAAFQDSRKRQTRDDVTTTADDFDDIPDRTTQRHDAEEDEAVKEPPAPQSHEVKRQENHVDSVISADVMDFLNDTGGFLSSRQRRVGAQLMLHVLLCMREFLFQAEAKEESVEVKDEDDPYKECRAVIKFAPLVVRAPRE